jgi:predicted transcriptional regulator
MKRGTEKDSAMRRQIAIQLKEQDFTVEDISEALGVSVQAVRYYLHWNEYRSKSRPDGRPYFKKALNISTEIH